MKNFISAIQFITILPAGKKMYYEPDGMIRYFPVVGILLGVLLALFDLLVCRLFSLSVASVLDVVFLACLTGGFHLDGLSDAADGLFSHRSKEKTLVIMKDSRVGALGMITLISVIAVKWAGLSSISLSEGIVMRFILLTAIPSLSRGSMLFAFKYMSYARKEGGTASDMFNPDRSFMEFIWLFIPIVLVMLTGLRGILILVVYILSVLGILIFYKKKIGGVTGDMLGAMTELTESILFLCAGMEGL